MAGKAVVRWEDEITRRAQMFRDAEKSVAMGNTIQLRGGIMQINDVPVKDNILDVIILDAILLNTYYKDKFNAKEVKSPICYAMGRDNDTLKPHEKSAQKQHPQCKGCWANEYDTNDRGGKACQNRRRLAVIPADTKLTAKAVQESNIHYVVVPVTSVKGWAAYVNKLDALLKTAPFGVVTTMEVVADNDTQFKLTFNAKEALKGDDVKRAVLSKVDEASKAISFAYPDYKEDGKKGGGKKKGVSADNDSPTPAARGGKGGKGKNGGRQRLF